MRPFYELINQADISLETSGMKSLQKRVAAASTNSNGVEQIDIYRADQASMGLPEALRLLCERLRRHRAPAWLGCAKKLAESDPTQARALIESARSLFPADKSLLSLHLDLCRRLGDDNELLSVLRQNLALNPKDQAAAAQLAVQLREVGRMSAATSIVLRHYNAKAKLPETLAAVDFLEGCRRTSEAYSVCQAAIDRGLSSSRLQYQAGVLALSLGQFDRAGEHLRAALDQPHPEWGALLPLALSRQHKSEDSDIVRYRNAWRSPVVPPSFRPFAGFALAKGHDDFGDFATAASFSRLANQESCNQGPRWDADRWSALIRDRLDTRRRPIPKLSAATHDEPAPLFVVGLPRTGTTLIAELLGRHPQARNRGELHWISFLDEQLRQSRRLYDPVALAMAAKRYRQHLLQDDAPAQIYIDKNPLNFRHLELISALFPDAHVIHCRRSPRDTALSNWMQMFGHPDVAWTYDFDAIASYTASHDQLMSELPSRLGLSIHAVEYENLLDNPDAVMTHVLKSVGLTPFDVVAAQNPPDSAIGTASAWQARQPLNRASIGRWQNYAEYLPELTEKFSH